MSPWPGTIRMATDADGPGIGVLFEEVGLAHDVDWTRPGIAGWWVVAELEGAIVGAIQLCLSKPWAHLSEIVTAPCQRGGTLAGMLYLAAMSMAQGAGCQLIFGMVSLDRGDGLAETLRHQRWIDVGQYVSLARRF